MSTSTPTDDAAVKVENPTPTPIPEVIIKEVPAKSEPIRIESKELRVMRDLHAFAIESAEKEVELKNQIKKLEGDLKKSQEATTKPLQEQIDELEKENDSLKKSLVVEKSRKDTKFIQGIALAVAFYILVKYLVGVNSL